MDIKHKIHKHPDGSAHKMQRVYVRKDKKYVPVGWSCVDCGYLQRD